MTPGVTEPDWYFLWLFKLVDFYGVTPVIAVGASTAILLFILFLPFLDRSKRTHPRDRPVFTWIGTSLLGFFILMTVWGGETPGLQISEMNVALTLAPVFLVNGVAIALLHWRYVRGYRRRLAARGRSFAGVSGAPRAAVTPLPGAPSAAEAKASD